MSTTKVVSPRQGCSWWPRGCGPSPLPGRSSNRWPPIHLALAWADGLLVALAGVGLGATAHALAHWLDRELGGSAADPWYLSAFALVLLAAAAWRWNELRR
jgi:hypothetical protein